MEYFDQAVDFIKQYTPSQTYKIAGKTIVQGDIISEGGYGYVYKAHDKANQSMNLIKHYFHYHILTIYFQIIVFSL